MCLEPMIIQMTRYMYKVIINNFQHPMYRKVEPYLTFLNIVQLETQGADIQSKVGESEELNESLRNRDKMKDDAIVQLSDQLMALTTRMQEIERRQQL